jgi:hypothetical protein
VEDIKGDSWEEEPEKGEGKSGNEIRLVFCPLVCPFLWFFTQDQKRFY